MKKTLSFFLLIGTLALTSCIDTGNSLLIGAWGVERIEYYTCDIAGNPIPSTMEAYEFSPGASDGITMTFRANNTGQLEDRSTDFPVVTSFTYRYDAREQMVFMNKGSESFVLYVEELGANTFSYLNEYENHKIERTFLKRLDGVRNHTGRRVQRLPVHPGSLLSGERIGLE